LRLPISRPAPQPVTAKVDFSGDGDLAGDGDDVMLGVIKVVDGDGVTLDDEPEPVPVPEPPEPAPPPEPVLPADDDCESLSVAGATDEVVYEVPLPR